MQHLRKKGSGNKTHLTPPIWILVKCIKQTHFFDQSFEEVTLI